MHPGQRLQTKLAAMLLATLFALIWAVIERIGRGIHVSSYQVVWTRYGTHLLLVVALSRRFPWTLGRTARPGLQIACSLLMLGMPLCFIGSVARMPFADTMSIFWGVSFMTVLLSPLVCGERTGWGEWAGIAAASAGAVLLTHPDHVPLRAAAVFPLGMVFCFALYQVLAREMRDEPVATKLFHTGFWVFLALSLALPRFWRAPSPRDVAIMVSIGVLGCGALFALDLALEIASPGVIAPALCTQPFWAALLEGKLSGAAPGAVLVLIGAGLAFLWRRPQHTLRSAAVTGKAGAA